MSYPPWFLAYSSSLSRETRSFDTNQNTIHHNGVDIAVDTESTITWSAIGETKSYFLIARNLHLSIKQGSTNLNNISHATFSKSREMLVRSLQVSGCQGAQEEF